MEKTIWISYDLDIRGDYTGLFSWLDTHDAKECGNLTAVLRYSIEKGDNLVSKLRDDLQKQVKFKESDRMYVVYEDEKTGLNKGTFIVGSRRKSPWQGYSQFVANSTVEDF